MLTKPWDQALNLLCIRLDALGDVMMTTPALRTLKEARPNRQVTLLTSPAGSRVAPLLPTIDTTLVYEAPWMKATALRSDASPEMALVDTLRRQHFDGAVIFTSYSQSPLPAALICYLAEIPLRLAHCRENPYQLLTTWIPESEPDQEIRHEVRRQLDLIATIGAPIREERLSIRIPDGLTDRVVAQLYDLGLNLQAPWVIVHPGASAPSRRYPPDRFASVARQLVEKMQLQVLFTGTALEEPLIEDIRQAMAYPSFSLAGRLALEEFTALLAQTPLLISNNTGPVHLAAAVGTPIIDLYALTNPQHTPWGVPHRVLFEDVPCKYCYKSVCPLGHHHCLSRLMPELVVQAVRDLAEETGAFARYPRRSP